MLESWYQSMMMVLGQSFGEFSMYIPRFLGAILILILGAAVARILKKGVVSLLETLMVAKVIKNTPLEHFFNHAEFGQKFEEVIGSVVYWLFMLVILQTVVSTLGLLPVSEVIERILSYIPSVISAVLILFMGVLLAGVVESLVKGSIKSIDGKSSRLLGKISSYAVMTIAVLAAVSELGIASEFIMILFVGFVTTISLGLGLALGLGGKDVVADILDNWYKSTKKEIEKD